MRNASTFLHQIHDFTGSPYEIGFKRGEMFANFLKDALDGLTYGNPYYKESWPKPEDYNLKYFKDKYPGQLKKWEKALENTPDWFREEWKGTAEGAGVSYEKLMLSKDLFPFIAPVKGESGVTNDLGDDCNGFVAFGKATADGIPIIGGNGETHHEAIRYLSLIRVKNKKGNNYIFQTKRPWFMACQAGMNDKGVCMFGSGVSIKPEEFGDISYGSGALSRMILHEANTLDEAIDLIKETPLRGGSHKYLADKKSAVHIETTGKNIEIIYPESGFSAGASPYFSSPNMTPYCNVISDETEPRFSWHTAKKRGSFRIERYHELYEAKKPLTITDIPSILGDHGGRGTGLVREDMAGICPQGSNYTICVHGSLTKGGEASNWSLKAPGSYHASAFSNISQPNKLILWMAAGSPCEAGYFPFSPPK